MDDAVDRTLVLNNTLKRHYLTNVSPALVYLEVQESDCSHQVIFWKVTNKLERLMEISSGKGQI